MSKIQYDEGQTQLAEKVGKQLVEHFGSRDSSVKEKLKESFGINFKESGQTTTSNPGSYTDALAKYLSDAAIKNVDAVLGLVNHDKTLTKGGNGVAVKLPRLKPTVAYKVAEGQKYQTFPEGIDSILVSPEKIVSGTTITWEQSKAGGFNPEGTVMNQAKDAVTRKLGSEILNGLAAGSGHTPLTGGVSYANYVDAMDTIGSATYDNGVSYGFMPNAIVVNTTGYKDMLNDSNFKEFIWRNTPAFKGTETVRHAFVDGLTSQLIITPLLTSSRGIVLVKKQNTLVWGDEGQMFEGKVPGAPYDKELVYVAQWALGVQQPKSVIAINA